MGNRRSSGSESGRIPGRIPTSDGFAAPFETKPCKAEAE